uniref:Uncharacterized protein n=1 Tax=Siphoviridae sp. ctt0c4 TaxID=2825702 RepID=A0A8S5V340_9CAUD|nr:MAG TPA: hypothetical protein [Siphoviridae sp. ctt0c4]
MHIQLYTLFNNIKRIHIFNNTSFYLCINANIYK